MKPFTFLFILLSFFTSIAFAQPLSVCETVLLGLKDVSPTPPQYPKTNRDFDLQVKQPKDGVGHLLVIDFKRELRMPLYMMARKFPEFFKRFDIYAARNVLIMPDAVRLSALSANGIGYQDMRTEGRNQFTEDESDQMLEQRKLLLNASNEDYFLHDRTVDHTLANLVMPKVLFEKLRARILIERDFVNSEFLKKETGFASYYQFHNRTRDTVWDDWTAMLGTRLIGFYHAETDQEIAVWIYKLAKQIKDSVNSADNYFDSVVQTYREISLTAEARERLVEQALTLRKEIAKKYPHDEIRNSVEFSKAEAFRIAHELTGIPLEKLKADYAKARFSEDLRDHL